MGIEMKNILNCGRWLDSLNYPYRAESATGIDTLGVIEASYIKNLITSPTSAPSNRTTLLNMVSPKPGPRFFGSLT